jgi:hypothetical protein
MLNPSGASTACSIDGIEAGISSGHDLIVDTFDRIASDTAKKEWGRRADIR